MGKVEELLKNSREKIDELDGMILRLLADRAAVVAEVAEVKKAQNLPVYHPAREEDLITSRRRKAGELGLSPDMAEEIFRTILRNSRITQTGTMAGKALRPGAKVLVVGGAGSMGRLLVKWFSGAGYEVRVLERDDWDKAGKLCEDLDLAILSVPINITAKVAENLSPFLSKDCILADITSIKKEPVQAMLSSHSGPVLGLHPMFGPTTESLDKQIVVATEGRDPEKCEWVVAQLAAWGAVIVRSNPAEHDEMMDVVQALRHFASFAFGRFLCDRKVSLRRTLEFSSPIYRLELDMVGRLFAQDPALYAEIIFSTPQRRELLKNYVKSLSENETLLDNADVDGFLGEFRRVAEWFGPFSDQAIRESTYLIEKMIERF
ncbi:bifunctional chorismate mutase/prephenate dehydrogenase [bacterium]|nr:MAG: bifunctional chorismate mutase/prephenate dehydrogenase [bacterium]